MTTKTDRYPLRFVEPGLKVQLEALAKEDGRSLNQYINRILIDHVKQDKH